MGNPQIALVNAILERGGKAKRNGEEFKATCPAHEDGNASLQIGLGEKGAIVHCHAGCSAAAIMEAVGMKVDDLFTAPLNKDKEGGSRHDEMPLRAAAPGAERTFVYDDANGKVLFRVERHPGKRFIQARPDPHSPGNWLYNLGDVTRVPYHLSSLIGAVKAGEMIFVVEGEKDVERLESLGLVATCNPGGAGKFKREFADFFLGADVVVIEDNDQPGRDHAGMVAAFCGAVARSVRVLSLPYLPDKGDVSDWLDMWADYYKQDETLDPAADLRWLVGFVDPCYTNRPVIFNAQSLMAEKFAEVVMAVPGVIAEGATFLVGAPKIGKSWMSLGLGLAVANGSMALGTIPVMEGEVLYLALEDTPRRLQRRLTVMLGVGVPAPTNLMFACQWPRLGAGGLDQLEDWMKDHPNARMVIIDTWAKVQSAIEGAGRGSMYADDYAAVSAVKSLADEYGIAVVMVHHQRKAADGDPLNTVAGSTGLTGAADATVILTRSRGAEDGQLYVTGRDVEESKSMVSFDPNTGMWTWLGDAQDVEENRLEEKVVQYIKDAGLPIGPKEVAEGLDIPEGTAKWLLPKLVTEKKLSRPARGKYTVYSDAAVAAPPGGSPVVVKQAVQPGLPGTDAPVLPAGVVPMTQEEIDAEVEKMLSDEEGFGADLDAILDEGEGDG